MDSENVFPPNNIFEKIKKVNEDGAEYWRGRELQVALGYKTWRSFLAVIKKATIACARSGINVEANFIEIPSVSGKRGRKSDCELSRYACYLVIENANPAFKAVAHWKAYFAIQTRKQEIAQKRAKHSQKYSVDMDFTTQSAHFFTQTQTEGKIKREGITGEFEREQAQNNVERIVLRAVSDLTGGVARGLLPEKSSEQKEFSSSDPELPIQQPYETRNNEESKNEG